MLRSLALAGTLVILIILRKQISCCLTAVTRVPFCCHKSSTDALLSDKAQARPFCLIPRRAQRHVGCAAENKAVVPLGGRWLRGDARELLEAGNVPFLDWALVTGVCSVCGNSSSEKFSKPV